MAGAAAILSTAPLAVNAQTPETDTAVAQMLSAKAAHGSCTVIACLDGDLTPTRQAQLAALGADVTRHLGFIHSAALTLPQHNLVKLAALPFITHLSYDGTVKKSDGFTDASSGAAYARQQYSLSGQGVTVAVVDSGIHTGHYDLKNSDGSLRTLAHPDLTSNPNYYDANGPEADWDRCGHGTHVAGIIGGNGASSTGSTYTHTYYGVAPQAKLVSVRVLDQNGASDVGTVVAGLQWIYNNRTKYNIRVVNLSLGHPVGDTYKNDPLCQAVESLWKAGIVVVCAAGNNGRASGTSTAGATNEGWGTAYGSIQSPANDPYVITVGATKNMDGNRADDKIATYSSRGPSRVDLILKPDIIAPGNKIISLDEDYSLLNAAYASTNLLPYSAYSTVNGTSNQMGVGDSNAYFVLSGTSMAAPVVAGAAALMLQNDPTLTPDTIKARLMVSADKWEAPLGTYEAEASGNTISGTAQAYHNTLFSSGGAVHNIGFSGALQFNQVSVPSAGTYTMTVAYINGDWNARTAMVSVNGGSPQTVSFSPLGNWFSYQITTVQVPIILKSGANTIKFSNPFCLAPDIDRIAVTQSDPLTFGAGYLNIPAALACTVVPTLPALSPALIIDSSGTVTVDTSVIASKAISGVSTIWGSKAISGVSTVYGSKAISGVSTIYASKAISGVSTTYSTSSVWSDKSISASSSASVDLSSIAAHGE